MTPIVPLSTEAWAFSFAKYLELRFYAGSYKRRASVEPCGHSLHKDHYQYFAYANMVASFKLVELSCSASSGLFLPPSTHKFSITFFCQSSVVLKHQFCGVA